MIRVSGSALRAHTWFVCWEVMLATLWSPVVSAKGEKWSRLSDVGALAVAWGAAVKIPSGLQRFHDSASEVLRDHPRLRQLLTSHAALPDSRNRTRHAKIWQRQALAR